VALQFPSTGKGAAQAVAAAAVGLALCGIPADCSSNASAPGLVPSAATLAFGPERRLGDADRNPSTSLLRHGPDARLYAIWTEDNAGRPAYLQRGASSPGTSLMRAVLLAWSADGGKSWSPPRRVNSAVEAVQGEESGPRIAFGADNRIYAVWSITDGAGGNLLRGNVRFAMEDGRGGFTPARTLNEVKGAARFPIVEVASDGTVLVGWVDRRIDNPKPRQLYLMRLGAEGKPLTKNYQVGEGMCDCCRIGMAFVDGGRTVYMVNRKVSPEQIRNHELRKSSDGGATFGPPVEISDDRWKVPFCPDSGPAIVRDSRGLLHVAWFTLGRSPEKEAGVYYAVSKDGGKSFTPRQLVDSNRIGAALLHVALAAGKDGTVYFAWDNLDGSSKAQIFVRALAPDGRRWGPVQQVSQAKENAWRPALAVSGKDVHVAWTEVDGEESWVVLRRASLVE